ncbi:MAG: YlmC/YmxH family sporulation protein [Clostridia bacterium]|nr:YlmC/YmxH family sporulation protein [Clostridia bacterium]
MNYTFRELRKKEIIDLCDGARLGFAEDLVIDGCGNILCVTVPPSGFHFPFGKGECLQIPWKNIQRITTETIWVKLNP